MRNYEFVQLDVFTRKALSGNPLAIFPDARGLSDAEMQALAREMNLSETTFILPRERAIEVQEGTRVRIFTPQEELPFAGHPTLGTALYLYHAGDRPAELMLHLNVGKISVRFEADASEAASERVDGRVFGEMGQRDPEFGTTLPAEKVARALEITAEDILPEAPVQVVSTGLPFLIVPIRTARALASLTAKNFVGAAALLDGAGARFPYFIATERVADKTEVRARMFFYGGEDPATGSAAGCAASWLVNHGLVRPNEQVLIRQGVEAGRPSELFVRANKSGDGVNNVRVGGHAVEILRGTAGL